MSRKDGLVWWAFCCVGMLASLFIFFYRLPSHIDHYSSHHCFWLWLCPPLFCSLPLVPVCLLSYPFLPSCHLSSFYVPSPPVMIVVKIFFRDILSWISCYHCETNCCLSIPRRISFNAPVFACRKMT